ncbi:SDR family oxidoreductase [Motilimonas cestriensis]|uniref:SDR family oxidoreductase n=1 Tax=Motilimonas cestriensis TaxID=2742685 RepID=A0ABS8W999_9GAMM|nr:SDR family NAD(P)-dependent oxidoreductase [Motilimonas cestriensis]MCE2595589.1 SDR family oxidoreductase [Motilimonas cestriensis]
MQRLVNKTVVIIGASQGIGLAMAELMLSEGAKVIAVARSKDKLEQLAQRLEKLDIYPLDITQTDNIKPFFVWLQKQGGLDVLINNAGIMEPKGFGFIKSDNLQQSFATNLFALFPLSQFAARLMSKKGGSIINVSSVLAQKATLGQAVYSASKAGVEALTKNLALELAGQKVRVNAIAPGSIDTSLLDNLTEQTLAQTLADIPMQRLGLPQEVAQLALFLASNESQYITGQVIAIDGGWSL